MNGKKKLKIVLLGVVILINIAVMGIVLLNPNDDMISQIKDEIEKDLSENSSVSEDKDEQIVKDYENLNDDVVNNDISSSVNNNSYSADSSSSANDNGYSNNSYSTDNSISVNGNSNLGNTSDNSTSDNINNNTGNNNGYQDTVVPSKKDYLNGTESTAYIQEKLDEKYSENGGVYLTNGSSIAYMLDGSLKTKEGHTIFYWGYFLNDEKPPYNGLNSLHSLYRVVTLNSVTKEYTDFGYKNGRTYEELGFRTGPKRD